MAYSAPSTVSTGDLCSASTWNQDVVANPIAIYAGAMSVTSQAVGDILYASSTTQFARIAAVATGQVLTSAGTGTVPAWSSNVDLGGTLDVTGATTLDSTLAVSSTAADAIDVAGGITAGTGNVALVGTDGKINGPLSSTIIDDLSGANLTTLNASNISSGTLANARLPTNVDLGGTLDVTGATTLDSTLAVAGDLNVDSGGLFVEADNSYVGLGTTSPASVLHVTGSVAAASTHMKGVQISPTVAAATGGWEAYGILCAPTITEAASDNAGNIIGVLVSPTITNGSGTATNATGIHVSTFAAGAGTTNAAGLKVIAPSGATNNAAAFFDGNVGVGTASPGARLEVEDGGITHPGPLLIVRQDTDDVWNTVLCNDAYSTTALYGCRMTVGTNGDFNVYAPDKTSDPGDIKLFTDETQRLVIDSAGDVYTNAWADYYASSTIVGWSSLTSGRRSIMTKRIGDLVFVAFHLEGTSNSTCTSFTVPYTSATVATAWSFGAPLLFTYDNTTAIQDPGRAVLDGNSNVVNVHLRMHSNVCQWTNEGSKIITGQFFYQAASA